MCIYVLLQCQVSWVLSPRDSDPEHVPREVLSLVDIPLQLHSEARGSLQQRVKLVSLVVRAVPYHERSSSPSRHCKQLLPQEDPSRKWHPPPKVQCRMGCFPSA